ncbi:MAG: tRNA (guanosine(46)-N7)-methyltransferase TrmB [Propionibacteriaceae bacterium]|nr:tRNA (guanosine(46)-N7)-methyltransferase TrmB [Propionibacteriaceae bacterium]
MPPDSVSRDVVSFVRRGPRMNPSQQRAWDRLRDRYVVEIPTGERETSIAAQATLDLREVFGRQAPLFVEIGIGSGETICELAGRFPAANLLGFEVFLPTVASCLARLEQANVDNVRIIVADGQQGVETLFSAGMGAIAELWTFFPDPWPKKRHHKRRLVNPAFAQIVAQRLAVGGRWRLATDWESYADWMREVLDDTAGLVNEYAEHGWAPRWEARPITKFEQRGINAGRTIRELSYLNPGAAQVSDSA